MRLFVDTSIFVDNLRSKTVTSSAAFLKSLGRDNEGFTSSIVVAELSVGAYLSPRKDALSKTMELLSLVSVADLNKEIAINGGKIYSNLVRNGLEIELNDCLIAATALYLGINKIVTRNIEHFDRISEVNAVTPEELGYE